MIARRRYRSLIVPIAAALALTAARPAPASAAATSSTTPAPKTTRDARPPVPRLEGFYEIATARDAELKRVTSANAALRRIRIGDTINYLTRRHGRPRSVEEKGKGTRAWQRLLQYDDFDVRVDADGRISRVRVRASGAWMMRNGLRRLMQDFSETRMRRLLGWNYRRHLERVYVWPISRSRFAQDQDRERLLRMVQQYYKLPSRAAAGKKIIRAWDTVYIYPDRGLRMRVYSNVPISGRFKADFILLKPAAQGTIPRPPSGSKTPPAPASRRPALTLSESARALSESALAARGTSGRGTSGGGEWVRDRALEAELAFRGVRGVTVLSRRRSLRLLGTVRDDKMLRKVYQFMKDKGFGEVDYDLEVR